MHYICWSFVVAPSSRYELLLSIASFGWVCGLGSLRHLDQKNSYSTSSDPHHDISIICLHAMVRSMLPWS